MQTCDFCNEPATKRVLLQQGIAFVKKHYCYLHALQEDFIDVPSEKIRQIAEKTGYSNNASLFVLFAISRSDKAETPKEACKAVLEFGSELFGPDRNQVFEKWKILDPSDVGIIAMSLVEAGLLKNESKLSFEDFRKYGLRLTSDGKLSG